MTGAKQSKVPKIILFMPVDHAKEFLEFGHSSNSFLPELLPQCTLSQGLILGGSNEIFLTDLNAALGVTST